MSKLDPSVGTDDERLSWAEQNLLTDRQALAEEEKTCGDAPYAQGISHRLAEAHHGLARSFEILAGLHRGIGNELVADYPDS